MLQYFEVIESDPKNVRDVVALLIGRVGDLIVATPFLRALRLRLPKARVRLVINTRCREAARMIPFIDETEVIYRLESPLKNVRTCARLLTQPCGILVDLNPSFSRTASFLAGLVRAPIKLAFDKGRRPSLYTHRAAAPGEREPMLDRYARLAKELGAPYEPRMELKLSAEDERQAEELMHRHDPKPNGLRVVFHPGNFKKFDNRWQEEKFVELADRLMAEPGRQVFFMAGPGEEAKVREIVAALKRPAPLLPPSPIGVAGALMRRMDACVLNITGTTHLAAALGVPTFGLYAGYTDAVWRPRGSIHGGVVADDWESCRSITVEAAHAALTQFLSGLESENRRAPVKL